MGQSNNTLKGGANPLDLVSSVNQFDRIPLFLTPRVVVFFPFLQMSIIWQTTNY